MCDWVKSMFLGQRVHVRLYKQRQERTEKEAGMTCFYDDANELQSYKSFVWICKRGRSSW